jgi:dephospho-CoA kinase
VLLIALTGNIASGKSEVARMFAELGATVIDADELARDVVRPGMPALAAIAQRWGKYVLQDDGSLDRAALRAIVFADPAEREALNAIVHPEVRRLRSQLIAQAKARGDSAVVAVIPLLFETGLETEFDKVILVDAPDDVRRARLMKRGGMDAAEARRMMDAQMPAITKRSRSHVVIENTSDLETLKHAVTRAWTDLTRQGIP